MVLSIFLLFLGLGILIFGADILVKGASSISKQLGIPQIIIGLTVVAFGTSAPELAINTVSAIKGTTDLAIGNIVGSNIGNILLILGISLTISEIKVHKNTAWKEIPFAILGAAILFIMAGDTYINGASENILTHSEGITLLGFFIIFLYYIFLVSFSKKEEGEEVVSYSTWKSILYIVLGLGMLSGGGELLVDEAVKIAQFAGVSEVVIGLTIVAVGTSLPELVTCVIAAKRKQTDIVIGNIIGSNIFNTFWILGITGTITQIHISSETFFDILFSFFVTVGVFLFLFLEKDIYTKGGIFSYIKNGESYILRRWHGVILVVLYIAYITYLIANS